MTKESFLDKYRPAIVGLVVDCIIINDPPMRARMICNLPHRVASILHQVWADVKGETNEIARDGLQEDGTVRRVPERREALPDAANRELPSVALHQVLPSRGPQKG